MTMKPKKKVRRQCTCKPVDQGVDMCEKHRKEMNEYYKESQEWMNAPMGKPESPKLSTRMLEKIKYAKMKRALKDIIVHSQAPFVKVDPRNDNWKWLNEINLVAREALK